MFLADKFRSVMAERALRKERAGEGPGSPTLVVLPCGGRWEGSSMLWGWDLGAELRKLGWRVTVVPPELDLGARRRVIAEEKPDAILMIKGRHDHNRPALYAPVPCVFVLDDADYVKQDEAELLAEACRTSSHVIAGNEPVAEWVRRHTDKTSIIWVSHPLRDPGFTPPDPATRRNVVAWAHATPMRYPDECKLMLESMRLASRRVDFEFWVYGYRDKPNYAEYAGQLRDAGVNLRTLPFLKRPEYLDTLYQAAVGLHPVCLSHDYSHGKSFGKALSYLVAGVPVVISNNLDHRYFFRNGENGFLANEPEEWAGAVERLLKDPGLRTRVAAQGYEDFERDLSTPSAAGKVDAILRAAIAADPRRRSAVAAG